MKKLSKILIALLLVIVALLSVAGCNADTQNNLQSKIDELESRIEELESQIEELEQKLYDTMSNEGHFYSVQMAYYNGWLTKDDVMSIAYYHNGGRSYNEEIMPENYTPQPKIPEELSTDTQLKIKSNIAKKYREEYNIEYAKADGITITQYCGTYGDCVAVMTRDDYTGSPGIVRTDVVAGVNFYYNDGKAVLIWMEDWQPAVAGKFYLLQTAYNFGWLTRQNLMTIANYHNNRLPYPTSLSEDMSQSIRQGYAQKITDENSTSKEITEEMVGILKYYGTYNGFVAVRLDRLGAEYPDVWAPIDIVIGGVTFNYQLYGPPQILVWKV